MKRHNYRVRRNPTPRRVSWLLILGVFVVADMMALMAWAAVQLADPNTLPIREVRIEGEFRQLKPERLRATVAAEVEGGFHTVQVAAIRAALLKDPWVKEVSVWRIWPDGLQVTVYERRAVAQWGNRGLLDPDGTLFSPAEDSYPAGLVKLEGPDGSEAQVLAKLRELERLLAGLDRGIAHLTLNSRRSWCFGLKTGPAVIVVGRADFDKRVRRFAAKYTELSREESGEWSHVDLRYPNGFAVSSRT